MSQARIDELEGELEQVTRQAEAEAERWANREDELERTLDVAAAKLHESEVAARSCVVVSSRPLFGSEKSPSRPVCSLAVPRRRLSLSERRRGG